tara:strand:- start:1718 stop:2047 length:330 start_codon:yes stop_codon:yes gene_type:complete
MPNNSNNGWNEYSRLVLEQLEALSLGIDSIRLELQAVNQELTIIKAKEDKVTELRTWKDKIDEVTSPSQLKSYLDDIQELKDFKTRAITIFAAAQAGMLAILSLMKYMG